MRKVPNKKGEVQRRAGQGCLTWLWLDRTFQIVGGQSWNQLTREYTGLRRDGRETCVGRTWEREVEAETPGLFDYKSQSWTLWLHWSKFKGWRWPNTIRKPRWKMTTSPRAWFCIRMCASPDLPASLVFESSHRCGDQFTAPTSLMHVQPTVPDQIQSPPWVYVLMLLMLLGELRAYGSVI